MQAALKKPTLDELNRGLKDLDHPQVDERMAVIFNANVLLESQGEGRETATKIVLMVGSTSDGISK